VHTSDCFLVVRLAKKQNYARFISVVQVEPPNALWFSC